MKFPYLKRLEPPSAGKTPPPDQKERLSYEKAHVLDQLCFLMAVVPNGQASAIVALEQKCEVAAAFVCHGMGTATSDIYEVFGLGENHKQIVFSLLKEGNWPKLKTLLAQRFAVSEASHGVAFLAKIDSLCGISVYKMMSNNRGLEGGKQTIPMNEETMTKRSDYEMVMFIVNDGFADLVMDAARKAGAKGGTIITARGTGTKDIEKFFGVVITPEKQIVVILVPHKIKDDVLNAVYKDVGINTKGQGIAFAIPATDVMGIVEDPAPQETPVLPQ